MTEAARGIIILEGPDGAGKTTLGRELVRQTGGLYMHLTLKSKMWRYQTAALRWAVRESQKRLVVVDRHWISENIYGQVYRQSSAFPIAARAVHRTWLRFGAVYVLCCPPPDYVVETVRRLKGERKEMYEADQKMKAVAQGFLDIWTGPDDDIQKPENPGALDLAAWMVSKGGVAGNQHWQFYDVTVHGRSMESYATRTIERLQAVRSHCYQPGLDFNHWNLSGRVSPHSTLLVGDRLSAENSGVKWPFYHNQNSSLYLMETLHKLGAEEEFLAYMNANDGVGEEALFAIAHAAEQCYKVVALGNEAARRLKQLKIEFNQVRHPQAAARFSRNDESYQHELEEAICD